jgi:hypothetical protein
MSNWVGQQRGGRGRWGESTGALDEATVGYKGLEASWGIWSEGHKEKRVCAGCAGCTWGLMGQSMGHHVRQSGAHRRLTYAECPRVVRRVVRTKYEGLHEEGAGPVMHHKDAGREVHGQRLAHGPQLRAQGCSNGEGDGGRASHSRNPI